MPTLIAGGCISPQKGPARKRRPWGGCLPVPKAYGFAENGRRERARRSGTVYFFHPVPAAGLRARRPTGREANIRQLRRREKA